MHKTVDNYSLLRLITKDSFGVQSFQCQHKILKKKFILKKLDYPNSLNQNQVDSDKDQKQNYHFECFLNEINLSKQLKNRRTLKCQKILKAKHSLYVVYNNHSPKSLQQMLETEFLPIQKKQHIVDELIQLVKQLHEENCIISNLYPSNIFFDNQDKDKIVIFNLMLAQCLSGNSTKHIENKYLENSQVQLQFYSPELKKYGIVSKQSDIFSLGVCMQKILNQTEMKKMLESMTDKNFQKRPSIEEVYKEFQILKNKSSIQKVSSTTKESNQMKKNKGLLSCKSLTFEQFGVFKDGKKMQQKKESFINSSRQLTKINNNNLKVKSRFSQNFDLQNSVSSTCLNTISQKSSNLAQSKVSSKLMISRQSINRQKLRGSKAYQQQSQNQTCIKEIFKIRSLSTFLQQMSFFWFENGQAELSFLLFKKAYILQKNNCQSVCKNSQKIQQNKKCVFEQIVAILKSELQKFQRIYHQYLKKLKQNQLNIDIEIQGYKKLAFNQQLLQEKIKSLAKKAVKSYQADQNSQQSKNSQKTKFKKAKSKKQEEVYNDQKLFNLLMLVKKLQYGTFQYFFEKKIHKQDGRYWHKNLFQVEKRFGKDYSLYQIKSILTLKK